MSITHVTDNYLFGARFCNLRTNLKLFQGFIPDLTCATTLRFDMIFNSLRGSQVTSLTGMINQ